MSSVKKILIIENDKFIAELIVRFLGKIIGTDFLLAYDGTTGLNMASSEKPDLIILDFYLPDIRGDVVIEYLKKRNISTKVVVLSANDKIEIVVGLIKQGAYDYVSKPVEPHVLLMAVKRALEIGELVNDKNILIEANSTLSLRLEKLLIENQKLRKKIKTLNKASVIQLWQEKLVHLEKALAIASDPAQVFQLGKQIADCKLQIKRLKM